MGTPELWINAKWALPLLDCSEPTCLLDLFLVLPNQQPGQHLTCLRSSNNHGILPAYKTVYHVGDVGEFIMLLM